MLQLKAVNLRFGKFQLKDINLKVEKGEYCVLLGESGSGKSVILNTIAGLYKPDSGKILLDEQDITLNKIQNRPLGMLFQDYALFPHLTVYENIAFSLTLKKAPKAEIKLVVEELAQKLDILALLPRRIRALSGGEKQRVALARVLAYGPKLLLLDEPLSALDVSLRADLRFLLKQINKSGISVLHVTHDFDEAISLADSIAVIQNGSIVQQGTAEEVFRNPNSAFVAQFAGIKNIFTCKSIGINQAITSKGLKIKALTNENADEKSILLIRGEDIFLSKQKMETSALNNFEGKITSMFINHFGMEIEVEAGETFVCQISMESAQLLDLKPGDWVCLSFKSTAVQLI